MESSEQPGRIFISYRRDDTAYAAGWLYDRLSEQFGSAQVFKDVDSLQPGDDFVEKITGAVGSCDVLLAVIGPDWATAADERGTPRLHQRGDFVRVEIEAALARRVRVIPLLVEGARMPQADDLPATLAPLVRRHALELTSGRFNRDADDLVVVLRKAITASSEERSTATSTHPRVTVAPEPLTAPTRRPRHFSGWGPWFRRHRWHVGLLLAAVVLAAAVFGVASLIRPDRASYADGLPTDVLIWRRDRQPDGGLATITVAGHAEKPLTDGGKADSSAVITRDRKAVLFLRKVTPSNRYEMHIVAPDGTGLRKLFADGTTTCPVLHRPAVDHDGRIAVVCSGFSTIGEEPKKRDDRLLLMQQDGTVLQTLATGQLGDPTFTSDGSSVVYWKNGAGTNEGGGALYKVPVDRSTDPVALTYGSSGQDADPACSPVSDEIAYRHESSDGTRSIRVIRASEGRDQKPRLLEAGGVRAQDPTWSPDGTRIAFRGGGSEADDPDTDLWVMDADGSHARQVVVNPDPDGVAAWSSR
ncbi:MAG TPA: TIR domain-containing protein [Propionibacteriaceae bacterium]